MSQRARLKYTDEVKAEIWGRWQKGETLNAIGRPTPLGTPIIH